MKVVAPLVVLAVLVAVSWLAVVVLVWAAIAVLAGVGS